MYYAYRVFLSRKGESHPNLRLDGPMKGDKYLNAVYAVFTRTAYQQLTDLFCRLSFAYNQIIAYFFKNEKLYILI